MSSMDNIRSFRAWPPTKEIAHHFSSCEPFHLRSVGGIPSGAAVREDLQTVQTLVDVSCASNDESFCGHPAHREKVDIKVADFLAAWNCYESGHMHWLLETDLRLYLSQCCMFCRSDPHLCELPGIEIIKHVCDLVNDNCGITVEQVNLWMNIQHSQSTLHYDANHNLLVLLEGSKTVTLLAPGCTRHLTPACAADEHPNHSSLSPQAVDSLVDAMKKSQDEDDSTYAGCIFHVVTIRAGDALFIPEGWWHQVVSGQCSMALNFWFPSSLQSWLRTDNLAAAPNVDDKPHISMNEYILRAAVHQLVQEEQRRSEVSHVAGSAGGASLYTNLSYQSFQSYILNDLLPAVDSSGVDSAILSGRKRAAVDAESEPTSASTENALERFVCCDFEDMQRLWVPFAAQHTVAWVALLQSLPPAACWRLLSYWDSLEAAANAVAVIADKAATVGQQTAEDGDKTAVRIKSGGESVGAGAAVLGDFFRDIFAPCGDAIPQVRGYMIAQKDKYRRKCAERALSRILGLNL